MFMLGGWKEQSFVSSVVVKAKGRTSLRLKKNAAMIKTRGLSRTRVACLKAAGESAACMGAAVGARTVQNATPQALTSF